MILINYTIVKITDNEFTANNKGIITKNFVAIELDFWFNLYVSVCHPGGARNRAACRYKDWEHMLYGEGGASMVDEKITIQDASEVDPNLLRMLDRGLKDTVTDEAQIKIHQKLTGKELTGIPHHPYDQPLLGSAFFVISLREEYA